MEKRVRARAIAHVFLGSSKVKLNVSEFERPCLYFLILYFVTWN